MRIRKGFGRKQAFLSHK